MEACFLTSSPFTFIKSRVFSCRNRNFSQFHTKKSGISSPITCCRWESSSPIDDDSNRLADADWRSFRARLVMEERASRSVEPLSASSLSSAAVDPDSAVDLPRSPPITIGDKWAHTLYEPEKGCLLVATEKLDGVHIFERTVILLFSIGLVGPSGIILNRPSLMSIKEMKSAALDAVGSLSERPLFFGGPLEEGLFLLSSKGVEDRVGKSGILMEVMKGLYYGTKENVGRVGEMVKRNVIGPEDIRFFDGYCGWEREQLREEIKAGYWTLAACSPSVIGLGNVASKGGLWEEILWLMGPKKVW